MPSPPLSSRPSPSGHAGRPRITSGSAAILVAVAGVVAGFLLFLGVMNVLGSGDTRSQGTERFVLGQADSLADTVARRGPLLLPDPLGRGRDVWVQHLGGSDWRTFDAHPPGAPARCVVTWEAGRRVFVDPCSGREHPADGSGLAGFPTEVDEDGRVVIDLRSPVAP
ncbi:MAG TPA: hypothetical protein VG455_03365, partial [Acidimicrobiales bacterium]|nr:hypothetical protein [Acidimicrobiales bacterium]